VEAGAGPCSGKPGVHWWWDRVSGELDRCGQRDQWEHGDRRWWRWWPFDDVRRSHRDDHEYHHRGQHGDRGYWRRWRHRPSGVCHDHSEQCDDLRELGPYRWWRRGPARDHDVQELDRCEQYGDEQLA